MALTGYDFDFGMQIPIDPDYVSLVETEQTSTRLGIAFPFKDQEISDAVYTRTYFDGRISYNFDTEEGAISDEPTSDFIVNVGAIDIFKPEEDPLGGTVEFDWETFDLNLNNTNNTLISQTLQDCVNNPKTVYDTYDANINTFDESDIVGASVNFYDGSLKELVEWWDVNNYNSLVLLNRVKIDRAVSTDSICKFFTNIYDISLVHYISFEGALDAPFYVNAVGRINNQIDTVTFGAVSYFKYTGEPFSGDLFPLIEKPTDVLYHFIEKELLLDGIMDSIKLESARLRCCVPSLAFSINEKIKAKTLITEISSNSNVFPVFRANSEFSLNYIAETYNDTDVVKTLKVKDILSYSIKRTPIIAINTAVNVKYKIDYNSASYKEETGYIDGYDMYGNKDSYLRNDLDGYSYAYLGLDKEDKVLEFEAKYIRDENSALKLRNFLFAYNCNQHNIFKLQMSLKYLNLEVGDVVNFDELIEGVKAYGENYTQKLIRNGQEIYPYFIVNAVSRKMEKISIEVTQLHNLKGNFQAHVGSITRARGIKNEITEYLEISEEDISELNLFLLGAKKYFTRGQKRVSDLNGNGYITTTDLFDLTDLAFEMTDILGDFNYDAVVDVTDVIIAVNGILGSEEEMDELMMSYNIDMNGDGIFNVIDIVQMVNQILEG